MLTVDKALSFLITKKKIRLYLKKKKLFNWAFWHFENDFFFIWCNYRGCINFCGGAYNSKRRLN